MRVELVPGMTNVVRFPVEFRVKPSLDLLREIAPDSREVDQVVDAWGFRACVQCSVGGGQGDGRAYFESRAA